VVAIGIALWGLLTFSLHFVQWGISNGQARIVDRDRRHAFSALPSADLRSDTRLHSAQPSKVVGLIDLGDRFDNKSISPHNKNKAMYQVPASFKSESDEYRRLILDPLEAALPEELREGGDYRPSLEVGTGLHRRTP
jgi:hypothetical protein